MTPASPSLSPPFSKYASRDALVYYVLSLPAIVAETIFSVSITSNPGNLVTQAGSYGGSAIISVQLLPWLILLASLYAIYAFRPSILVILLVTSFFIAVSISNAITLLGAQLDLAAIVLLVIAASFLALAGFNYARGLKLLAGRQLKVTSSGPIGYQVLGIALESAIPLAAALALVALVGAVVAALGVQAALLPQPLSTLSTIYLKTRVGVVFTTLFVAGATIWILRQVLEPILLYFTLTADDAKKALLSEIEPTTKTVRKFLRYRPSRGTGWGVLTVVYCLVLVVALAVLLPRGQFYNDLSAAFNLQSPSPSPVEVLIQRSSENLAARSDLAFSQVEDYVRTIIRLLWG
jgi:hypothetical protein